MAEPYGSFEDWSRRIREPLIWLGRADPCESVAKVRDNDPARTALAGVLMHWKEVFGVNKRRTVQQVLSAALVNSDLHSALVAVAGNQSGLLISNERLGRWLSKVEGKIVNDLRLIRDGNEHGHWLWKLQAL